MPVALRPARFPEDDALGVRFIMELQRYEHAIEPDRRLDPAVGPEFLTVLKERMAAQNGVAWIAEADGAPAGWALCLEDAQEIYVEEAQRRYFVVQELFVEDAWRGKGVGRLLLAAAEAEARRRGFARLAIGVLDGNAQARSAYAAFGFRDASRWMMKPL